MARKTVGDCKSLWHLDKITNNIVNLSLTIITLKCAITTCLKNIKITKYIIIWSLNNNKCPQMILVCNSHLLFELKIFPLCLA